MVRAFVRRLAMAGNLVQGWYNVHVLKAAWHIGHRARYRD
jgi:hypothetical protein